MENPSAGGSRSSLQRIAVGHAIALGVACLFLVLYLGGGLGGLGRLVYDTNFLLMPAEPDERIVIASLDEETARKLTGGRLSGWGRKHQARVIENLAAAGAEVVALDFVYSSPTNKEADDAFAAALETCECVVLACELPPDAERIAFPLERFRELAFACGHIQMYPGGGGVYRDMIYHLAGEEFAAESLALQVVYAFEYLEEGDTDFEHEDGVKYGNHILPRSRMPINFPARVPGKGRCYKWLPMWRIHENQFDPAEVKGKVVLMGPTHYLSQDLKNTPTWSKMPGVELHAAAITSILNDSFIRITPRWKVALVLAALSLAAGAVSAHPRTGLGAAVIVAAAPAAAAVGASSYAFARWHVFFDWPPVVTAAIAGSVAGGGYSWILEKRRAAQVTGIFGKYVSKNVVNALLAGEAAVEMAGRRKELSVLFCDIRGFTTLSEKMPPVEVGKLLNTYFSEMIRAVFAGGGTMDKLMGDCIMAFFGDPLPNEKHAVAACRCALAMLAVVERINGSRPEGERINVGIGVNTGQVTVGNLGASDFVDYTVIGDNVNLASRLEGLNKVYGTQTVIGEPTRSAVEGEFEFREIDLVAVKGRAEPVRIFEVLGETGKVPAERLQLREEFAEALRLYREAEFEAARAAFRVLSEQFGDEPSRLFVMRSQEYMHNPPGPGWDGSHVATSK